MKIKEWMFQAYKILMLGCMSSALKLVPSQRNAQAKLNIRKCRRSTKATWEKSRFSNAGKLGNLLRLNTVLLQANYAGTPLRKVRVDT
jgi:hypothetical protein